MRSRTGKLRRGAAVLMAVLMSVVAACGSDGSSDSDVNLPAPSDPPGLKSIVQLGDSIASGEGTLYGYVYDPKTQTWTGGNPNVKWPDPYPLCHVSPDAYGNVVAKELEASLSQFACTGATFANGIAAPRVNEGYIWNTTLRPAEFGNWTTQKDINADYDTAKPDLVLITLGADDLSFAAIVEACIENGYEYAVGAANLECVAANPGSTVEKLYFQQLPAVEANYKTLVSWIQARGGKVGKVPKILFTNYANPFPPAGVKCPDTNWLYPQQVEYLSSLVDMVNQSITTTIRGLNDAGVALADISQAMVGADTVSHRWCTDDPWAYGLSIYTGYDPANWTSLAPFHPTPDGQRRIAQLVMPVVESLFPSPTTTTTSR